MNNTIKKKYLFIFLCILLIPFIMSCSTTKFLFQAARGQLKLLSKVTPVEEVIKDKKTDKNVKDRLILLSEVLKYSKDVGLNVTNQYQTYVSWDDPNLVYLLTASEKSSLTPRKWKFPIAGEFPYLGFFEKTDALEMQKEMSELDTYIRGARAYSSLGWFPDPMVSTMMKMSKISFSTMVVHELVHSTVFFKGQVSFNEQLASFFAEMAIDNWVSEGAFASNQELNDYKNERAERKVIKETFSEMENELNLLYNDKAKKTTEKLIERDEVFKKYSAKLAPLYSSENKKVTPDKVLLNNAVVIANRTYSGNQEDFKKLFVLCEGSGKVKLKNFIRKIKSIGKKGADSVSALKSAKTCELSK